MKTCVIIGGGSSVRDGIEKGLWNKISHLEIWSINFAYLFIPYLPQREIFFDTSFFKQKIDDLQNLHSKGVNLFSKRAPIYDNFKDKVKTFDAVRVAKDWTENNLFVGQRGLSGTMALSLAIKEKYDTIYLLGYDFGTTSYENKETHFYIDKLKEYNIKSSGVGNTAIYQESNNAMHASVRDYETFLPYKNNIVNVSINSNIPYFERITYEEFFNRIKNNNESD